MFSDMSVIDHKFGVIRNHSLGLQLFGLPKKFTVFGVFSLFPRKWITIDRSILFWFKSFPDLEILTHSHQWKFLLSKLLSWNEQGLTVFEAVLSLPHIFKESEYLY